MQRPVTGLYPKKTFFFGGGEGGGGGVGVIGRIFPLKAFTSFFFGGGGNGGGGGVIRYSLQE